MKPPITATALYNRITKAAKAHGEDSEPDHEVGDLQDCLGGGPEAHGSCPA